ncbi:hypothetical protein FRC01_001642 [Tulasnella sp. 417]|nr:hypothetical protein FRC01_001642 [Tulasnella sp. 417]
MDLLSELVQERLDVFLEDLLGAAGKLSPAVSSTAVKIKIFDTIDKIIRRRRNEHTHFIQLPADVVRLIFGMALNLDRIHDPDLPLDALEEHRRNLFKMRRVSVAWNAFLLARPEYWCAIDVTSPAPESIARAQQTPLCLFSKRGSGVGSTPALERLNSVLLGRMKQVRTLRLDKEDAYDFAIRSLRAGLPDLETLELTKATDWDDMGEEFVPENIGDQLPSIRHLTTVGWQPSADALWLQNLKVLILKSPLELNSHLLRVLSACRNLSKLTLHADDGPESAEEMTDAPSLVDLPHLEEINLEVLMCPDVGYILPILRLPSHSRRFLRIDDEISVEASHSDICRFLYPYPDGSLPPQETTMKIYSDPSSYPRVTYTAGTAGLDLSPALDDPSSTEFPALIQAVQTHIKSPPLTVILHDVDEWGVLIWQRLRDFHMAKIWVKYMERMGLVEVLERLGNKHAPFAPKPAEEEETWPFESLEELTLEETELDPGRLIKMVEARQQYLREFSKAWLKRITLISCLIYGTRLDDAVPRLAAMGVTLISDRFSD